MAKLLDKVKDFILPAEENELELSKEEVSSLSSYEQAKNSGMSNITAETDIVLLEPRVFEEANEIAIHIKSHKACCINLHHLDVQYRQRVIDFLSGVIYGVDGTIKKIGDTVYLCSPKNLQVGGNIDVTSVNNEDTSNY